METLLKLWEISEKITFVVFAEFSTKRNIFWGARIDLWGIFPEILWVFDCEIAVFWYGWGSDLILGNVGDIFWKVCGKLR